MRLRGTYNFEVDDFGNILHSQNNVELLRKLWLDRDLIKANELGPGDNDEFKNGTWHIACHLVAASCVRKTNEGKILLLEILFNNTDNIYYPALTIRENGNIISLNSNSESAKNYIRNSKLLGFIEGNSEGKISASGVKDSPNSFAGNPRQNYDQVPGSKNEGGKVWEHWSTTRDIRSTSVIGSSVIDSYIAFVSVCGDKFVSTISRGRKAYFHPQQLKAMIKAGFVSLESANWNIKPLLIPLEINLLLQEARSESSYQAIEKLDWSDPPKYYMFARSIDGWNDNFQYM